MQNLLSPLEPLSRDSLGHQQHAKKQVQKSHFTLKCCVKVKQCYLTYICIFWFDLGLSIPCSSLEECIVDGSKQIGQYFQKLINYSKEIKVTKEEEDTCRTIILVFIIVLIYGLLIRFFFSQLTPDNEKTCQGKFAADMELTNVQVMKIQTYDLPPSKIIRKTEKK